MVSVNEGNTVSILSVIEGGKVSSTGNTKVSVGVGHGSIETPTSSDTSNVHVADRGTLSVIVSDGQISSTIDVSAIAHGQDEVSVVVNVDVGDGDCVEDCVDDCVDDCVGGFFFRGLVLNFPPVISQAFF